MPNSPLQKDFIGCETFEPLLGSMNDKTENFFRHNDDNEEEAMKSVAL